jgi:hypothetical protein
VKDGAEADRAALRQQLLDAGRTFDDAAAEMRRRWRLRPRESYRHAHGWSQDEVAVRFTGVAARLAAGTRAVLDRQPAAPPAFVATVASRPAAELVGNLAQSERIAS